MDIFELAEHNQRTAWEVLEETGIILAWESIGATVNLVGSLKTGLLMKRRNIDIHIYSQTLDISESFSVIQNMAHKSIFKDILYKNLINIKEERIEWHVKYEDKEHNIWDLDMIHIKKGSKYDGASERVTDSIIKQLTPDIRQTILQVKYDLPSDVSIPGIEIYQAVFDGEVKSYAQLEEWRKNNPLRSSMDWLP